VKVHLDALWAEGGTGGFLFLYLFLLVLGEGTVFGGVLLGQTKGGTFEIHGIVVGVGWG
jgi:hypothetical protein